MYTVKWFQVLLYNSQNLASAIGLHAQFVLFDPKIGPKPVPPLPGQSEPGSNGNEGAFHILQIFKAGASPSDTLALYPGHSLLGSLTPLQWWSILLEYSTAAANWAVLGKEFLSLYNCANKWLKTKEKAIKKMELQKYSYDYH